MTPRREDRPEWPERAELRVLNHDQTRVDGPDKVTGRARYTHDVRLPGLVWTRLVCCPLPRAEVRVDLAPARAVEGVLDARGCLLGDSPTEGETLFLGQPIAAVTATTPELAEDGARALGLAIEELEFSVTADQALDDFAAPVTEEGNKRPNREVGDFDAAERALDDADVYVEAEYRLPVQHHACLETHGAVVDFSGGSEARVYSSNQAVSFVPQQAAPALGLSTAQVEGVTEHMGGGFGSKFALGFEGRVACEISRDLGRPVHLMLTRPQEFVMAGNRSGSIQRVRAGATADGRLSALSAEVLRLGGVERGSHPGLPYIYSVAGDAYFRTDHSVHTNTDGNRAMRAPGHPQASFAMESIVDELAYQLRMDPLEFRKKNLPDPVYHRQLDRVAAEIGWADHPHKTDYDQSDAWTKRGIGFGVSTWGGGGRPGCGCEVKIRPDGSVQVSVGVQDLGTGVRTMVGAIVAEELGLEVRDVHARVGRSSYPPGVGSGGSVTTACVTPPVKDAAHQARAALLSRLEAALGRAPGELAIAERAIVDRDGVVVASWSEACAEIGPDGVTATSTRFDPQSWGQIGHLASVGVHGAQAAAVAVDTLTGRVRVERIVHVQDCGLPMNRLALRSQLNGGLIQGLGYGLLEERVIDPDLGVALNANLEDYKIPGALEIPELVSIIDDDDVGRGPVGIGEPPVIPGQSVIANAIYNACGVRLRELPFSPDRVLVGLEALGGGR